MGHEHSSKQMLWNHLDMFTTPHCFLQSCLCCEQSLMHRAEKQNGLYILSYASFECSVDKLHLQKVATVVISGDQ